MLRLLSYFSLEIGQLYRGQTGRPACNARRNAVVVVIDVFIWEFVAALQPFPSLCFSRWGRWLSAFVWLVILTRNESHVDFVDAVL